MVNPGSFRGSRKDFLLGKKFEYSVAVRSNYVADAVAKIQRQYLKRYPIDLPHEEEPSEAFLQAVDDNAPDPEPEEPNPDTMSKEEYDAAIRQLRDRKELLEFRKNQIKRWMHYQYTKDNDRVKESGAYMPYTTLMKKLTGNDCVRPRQKTPTNLWRKGQRELIEKHLQGEIEFQKRFGTIIPSSQYAAIRDRLARELFSELDEAVQREWREKSKEEHRIALEKYKKGVTSNPSMDPGDIQRTIQGLVQFMQPILDMVGAATGWKVSLLAGGPEPARGGQLSVISMHSGYTSGDIKMTYGRAERARFKKYVIPSFGSFLKLCYTPEECRARALPVDHEGIMPMCEGENDTDEATFHKVETPLPDKNPHTTDSDGEVQAIPQVSIQKLTPPEPTISQTAELTPPEPTISQTADEGVGKALASAETQPSSNTTCDDHSTQDSRPMDANPFPFEDIFDDDDIGSLGSLSRAVSPLPSTPPSPVVSRQPSPECFAQPLPVIRSVIDPVVMPVIGEIPTPSTLVPTSAIDSATVIDSHPPVMPITLVSPTIPSVDSTIPPKPMLLERTPANTKDVEPRPHGSQKGRKRKNEGVAAHVLVEEPVSKRARTKTARAVASEEQNVGRKRATIGTGVRGKENSTTSGKTKRR